MSQQDNQPQKIVIDISNIWRPKEHRGFFVRHYFTYAMTAENSGITLIKVYEELASSRNWWRSTCGAYVDNEIDKCPKCEEIRP